MSKSPRRPLSDRIRFARISPRQVWGSLWFLPSIYVTGALVLSFGLVHWDRADPIRLSQSIDTSSATAALSALGSGMLAFTGFVTSVVLMLVQFGSSLFSSRFVARLRRNRTLIFSLSTFSATLLFVLVSTSQIGRGRATFVPTRTLDAGLFLTLLSVVMFFIHLRRIAAIASGIPEGQRTDALVPDRQGIGISRS
jgi:uncharacterized membrane protein